MDWQALQDGLAAWLAAESGMLVGDVLWDDEPEGYIGLATATLRLRAHNSAGGSDDVRYGAQGPNEDATVSAVGNRSMTLSIKVRTRDASGATRPYSILERVRDRLELPSTQDAFDALGIGLIGTAALVDVSPVRDRRREPTAVLDLRMSYASDSSEASPAPADTIGTIEHVHVSGTVSADGASIATTEQTIP